MSAVRYAIADLVPTGLYATQVRTLLSEAGRLVDTLAEEDFRRDRLDSAFRELSARNQVPPVDLYKVLRVALAWPNARPDLFEVIGELGKDGTVGRLEAAFTRLTDEA